MNDKEPQQPESQSAISEPELVGSSLPPMPPAPPTAPLPWAAPPPRKGKRGLVIGAAVAALLLAGGGVAWWALADDDAMDHVRITDGKYISGESDDTYDDSEDCESDDWDSDDCYDDTDTDSDDDDSYEFKYKITNKGDGPANYAVIVNAFDEDGEFVGQTYVSATHLAAGKSDSDTGEFGQYDTIEDGHEISDIKSVKVAWVERVSLAN